MMQSIRTVHWFKSSTLVSLIRLAWLAQKLKDFHLRKLKQIDETDFSEVKRLVRKDFKEKGVTVSDGYLDEGVLGLKQYYFIPVVDPLNMHAVPDSLDPFWHAHILDTAAYTRFCHEVFGEYLHHKPLDHEKKPEVDFVQEAYNYTRQANVAIMFVDANEQWWPSNPPEQSLVCLHSAVKNPRIRGRALFSVNPQLQPEIYDAVAA